MKPIIKFDPRSKLCTILFASFSLMLPLNFNFEVSLVTFFFFLLLINGAVKNAIICYGLFWGLAIIDFQVLLQIEQPNMFIHFISFLVIGTRRLLPTIMAASFAVHGTKISEWIAALKKLRVPFNLIVALTVLFRFFPTLMADFKQIRQSLKFRGIAENNFQLFLKPITTMEYIIIPILFSADMMTNDLSAAALVRGLGYSENYTSVYPLKFHMQDYILLLFLIAGALWRLIG